MGLGDCSISEPHVPSKEVQGNVIHNTVVLSKSYCKVLFLRRKKNTQDKINRRNHKGKTHRKASCKKIQKANNKLGNKFIINMANGTIINI